jgi:diguanylate cyclase (GGDEF)-like protein
VDVTASNLIDDPTVGGLVMTIRDVTDRKLFEQQLEHQAFHDPLTGLANRALLTNRVEHALSRSHRRPTKPAIIYLDLDNFKRVNDSQGHDAGDQVLLEVARRLRLTLRDGDTAARLGGDEFAVLLEDTADVEEAGFIADYVRDELTRPISLEAGALSIGGSMGIVRADGHETGAIELLRNADIAMYEAKRHARGSHRIFEPAMLSATVERVRLEEDLRLALDHGELALVYQPLVRLRDRTTVGFEALIRWNHPQRGLIMPIAFVPIAEQTGDIVEIGRWVLEEACRTIGAWNADQGLSLRANVNVSVRQLVPSFVDDVQEILRRTKFPPQLLVIELTESVLAANIDVVLAILDRLRAFGVRVALDDFGTGYSSLSYLHNLPVDEIKIDRSFVESLTRRGDTRLISTIIGLGRKLGLTMIAEGIELEAQADQLLALGCEVGQGYLIGRPASGAVAAKGITRSIALLEEPVSA